MAAKINLVNDLVRKSLISRCIQQPICITVRTSRYNKAYLDPTFDKEELAKPMDENDPRKYQPIKAATPEQTSSVNFNPLVAKFIRHILREGDRDRAHTIVNRTFEKIKIIQLERFHKAKSDVERDSIELNPHVIFEKAVGNCRPLLTLQKVIRGGVLYQVPIPVGDNYATFKAMQWLIESGREKDDKVRIWDRFSYELIDAANNEGKSVKKKQELHRICEANRAYAHFRW